MSTLRQLRIRKGYSQAKLSEMANVTQATISKVERGKVYPRPMTRFRIESALNERVQWTMRRRSPEVESDDASYHEAIKDFADAIRKYENLIMERNEIERKRDKLAREIDELEKLREKLLSE